MIDPGLTKPDCIRTVDNILSLDVFKELNCAATLLRRSMPLDVQTWLEDIPADQLPEGRVILRPNAVLDAVFHLCDMVDLPKGFERDWFQEDMIGLAEAFAGLMDAPFLRLRLDVVRTNACRKFHVDHIPARLICTYRGTGTQYGLSVRGEDPHQIFTVEKGTAILLRGNLWPEEPGSGLVHRSPPIEGTGETRLVLVLDPIHDPEGEI